MNAKEYLSQIRALDARINEKLEEVMRLQTLATKITTTMRHDAGGRSGTSDKVGSIVAKLIDLQNELGCDVDALVDLKREAMGIIERIENPAYYKLLFKRYVKYQTLEKIAADMGYSYRNICYLHGRALQAVEALRMQREEEKR